ncbi:zf-HC2 domain-containing protein [Desulfobacterota bacterium AH_259_B03_O07]|nr:zf-HC2 domain-containing protein [Desulfobacterota bacterium AH_259_B03_O07]
MVKKMTSKRSRSKKVETCKQATSLIMDYLTGEMNSMTKRAFEEHLSFCPDCIAFLRTYKKTIQAVQSFFDTIPLKKKGFQQTLKRKLKKKIN